MNTLDKALMVDDARLLNDDAVIPVDQANAANLDAEQGSALPQLPPAPFSETGKNEGDTSTPDQPEAMVVPANLPNPTCGCPDGDNDGDAPGQGGSSSDGNASFASIPTLAT